MELPWILLWFTGVIGRCTETPASEVYSLSLSQEVKLVLRYRTTVEPGQIHNVYIITDDNIVNEIIRKASLI